MELKQLLEIAKTAATKAAVSVLEIYQSGDFSIEAKADDSPLTLADKASHLAIVAELEKTQIPILSEEGAKIEFSERKEWEYFWMIDPLDGTKEFIKRNGEFTINIALIHGGKSILGVVQVPVRDELYFSIQGEGAFKEANGKINELKINKISMADSGLRVVASRSHLSDETQRFMDGLNSPEIVSMGSSLKLLAVAEGTADLYPRFAPTMEWDTAAAQAIVEAAGGSVTIQGTNKPVVYNKENLLNPHFFVSCELKN
ncbi:3'(2'),5'-bisphosphate nucleotidase CysQ [Reichenbachiella agarivorans]|uniref:3'(2'),5'-bisphosphate nucleotidase CysQ n=1 Tax=Reichenbachiella agarivorans TaxID=2979464 RepID=A0ABY6CT95_9BACT|nr:3'(2'),5'-bisphosphate nucleotidase CysQ [Reichenbachiella agarivorans]UXP33559.1 3'(2'),5'-bisphosphate nucleotidase CysQ [Reichenbachiella agarivorans]